MAYEEFLGLLDCDIAFSIGLMTDVLMSLTPKDDNPMVNNIKKVTPKGKKSKKKHHKSHQRK